MSSDVRSKCDEHYMKFIMELHNKIEAEYNAWKAFHNIE
jgi:hypothetical protein